MECLVSQAPAGLRELEELGLALSALSWEEDYNFEDALFGQAALHISENGYFVLLTVVPTTARPGRRFGRQVPVGADAGAGTGAFLYPLRAADFGRHGDLGLDLDF